MKVYCYCLLMLLSISCAKKDDNIKIDKVDISGKWNLYVYEDEEGVERKSTYIIFAFYEQGFEFTVDNKFYPRYNPGHRFDAEEWETDYSIGPGIYKIHSNKITLSFKEKSYDYSLKIVDSNMIQLSNMNSESNPWTGKWTLKRE